MSKYNDSDSALFPGQYVKYTDRTNPSKYLIGKITSIDEGKINIVVVESHVDFISIGKTTWGNKSVLILCEDYVEV